MAAILLLGGCFQQHAEPEAATAEITRAEATSNTSFLLRFSHPVGDGADVASNYLVRDPDGVMLPIVAAYPFDGGSAVRLATEPQADVPYTITVRNVALASGGGRDAEMVTPGSVRGSATAAPVVAGAVALSNTKLLVSFGAASGGGARMNDDALATGAYTLDPALEVKEAAFSDDGADRGRVVLTTASMQGGKYVLRVGPVTSGEGAALLDPFRSQQTFVGIAAKDETPPELVEVYATDATTVVASFSEPVGEHASDPSRYTIADGSGGHVAVSSAARGLHGTRVTLATSALDPARSYTLTVNDLRDLADNVIVDGESAAFAGVASGPDGAAPRVTGATSTGPTRVLVAFSEPVRGGADSAENPDHYSIVGSATLAGTVATQAIVEVTAAELADHGRSVVLTTLPQSDIEYTLRVSNVVDLDGNPLAGLTREHPFEVEFFGSAESGAGTDSDGDGVSDAAEQRGWTVTVVQADGATTRREVSSDPYAPDTDGDGLPDASEKTYRTDPRAADTDQDDLTDARELNETYSEPTEVDSDGDGLGDGLEVDFFTTSPLFADTDGDQFSDDYEVTTDNRNPRVADLPVVEIEVGAVDLQLDVRFEEHTSRGTTTVDSKSVSTTLERSDSSRTSTVNSSTMEGFFEAYGSACYGGGCPSGGEMLANFGVSLEVGGGFSTSDTTTTTTESVRASQSAYGNSLTTEHEASAQASIERVVEAASMAVAVSITNPGNVAYTVHDIEITALVQNGRDPSSQVPVATLFAASPGSVSVGPLNPTRGPFRFVAQDTFPQLIEQLMQNPRGIEFSVANYTLEDEFGRRFAFVQQDVNDRTAGFEIDYAGNREREIHRLATNAGFSSSGAPIGVSMADVLEGVLGLEHVPESEDVALDPTVRDDAERIAATYSTRLVGGVEVLHRVRDVSQELTGEEREWWVITSDGLVSPVADNPGRDFRSVTVLAEDDFVFKFVQDLDGDGIEKAVEGTYPSVDSDDDVLNNACFGDPLADPDSADCRRADGVPDSIDSDRDGIADGVEPFGPYVGNGREPWTIRFDDGRDAYRTTSSPARADSDGDGLTDCQELIATDDGTIHGTPLPCSQIVVYRDQEGHATLDDTGDVLVSLTLPSPTDPAAIDTDGDGLADAEEVLGFTYEGLDGQTIALRPSVADGPATNPLSRDHDHDGLEDRLEILLGSDPTVGDADHVLDDDGDGLVNLQETSGWEVTWIDGAGERTALDVSDPSLADTDGDGLTDWEEYHGCRDADGDFSCDTRDRFGPTRPIFRDTDADGLGDREEVDGVEFLGDGTMRYTDPLDIDVDGDGRTDGDELSTPWTVFVTGRGGERVWSDPLLADADGDQLNDHVEWSLESHPGRADTDGDDALDNLEHLRDTDLLTPDHYVTVTYLGLQTGKGGQDANADCDDGSNPGDFGFVFSVGFPTPEGRSVEAVTSHDAVDVEPCTSSQDGGPCRNANDHIQLASPFRLGIDASRSFAVPFTELFTIEGWLQELEPTGADLSYYFGGIGSAEGVYDGSSLAKGSFGIAFNDPPLALDGRTCLVEVTVQVQVQ